MVKRKFLVSVLVCVIVNSGDALMKSSLTFVIDDTGSMENDIKAVEAGANAIFDTVMNSNASQIEDFVLVTFNDPFITYRTTTKDRNEFKRALRNIFVHGGGTCPEMSMSGIEEAVNRSRVGSLIYVFTDASSRDPEKYDTVKKLAQDKQCRVTFVLTGDCKGKRDVGNEIVYDDLAKHTDGQVFHLDQRGEITKILIYVQTQINSRKLVIAKHSFLAGKHQFDFDVDSKMKEIEISVSGTNPSITVTGPSGEVKPTEDIVRTKTVAIIIVKELVPGTYTTEIHSSSNTSVVVTAETKVHFQHGFSIEKPITLNDTTIKPIPGEKSYISIQLITEDEDSIKLESVQILDMDHNVISNESLKLVNVKNQFYTSLRPVVPPNTSFRVAIKLYDPVTKKQMTRISLTPIEPQSIDPDIPPQLPVITLTDHNIVAKYNKTLELRCKVKAYPKPNITWENISGMELKAKFQTSLVLMPTDYVSILTIDSVTANVTYMCIANNALGGAGQTVNVRTINDNYFKVVKRPLGATLPLGKQARFECRIDANPPATIKWYKGEKLVTKSDNIRISGDGSILTIKRVQPKNGGIFYCEAKSGNVGHKLRFLLRVTGIENPLIEKSEQSTQVKEGSSAIIRCRIIKGNPRPTIRWYFKHKFDETEIDLFGKENKEELLLEKVASDDSGTYRCEATNVVGFDFHNTQLFVGSRPKVARENEHVTVKEGERIRLPCTVAGVPKPVVKWYFNGTELKDFKRYIRKDDDDSLVFKASLRDAGTYLCDAENEYGKDSKYTHLNVVIPPNIEIPVKSTLTVKVGDYVVLPCHADGYPKPILTWEFRSISPEIPLRKIKPDDESGKLIIKRIQLPQQGYYTCLATNFGGSINITYDVRVFAPPDIKVDNPKLPFYGVEGDLVLRIPCHTTGSPQPAITWMKDGLNIPAGTEWYDVEQDGTLVIKNLDTKAKGFYTCQAKNYLGVDTDSFEVIIDESPKSQTPKTLVAVEEGKSTILTCNLEHKKTDVVRWFKDGKLLSAGEIYHLKRAEVRDSGVYMCRVNDFTGARTESVQVAVGFAPRFLLPKVDSDIYYEEGLYTNDMDCSAIGQPEPKVTWWHNGNVIPETKMVHDFTMSVADRGQYYCSIVNKYGYIIREFNLISEDCFLDIWSEIKEHQPLMLSSSSVNLKWPKFITKGRYINIHSDDQLSLACPTGFKNFPDEKKITLAVTCDSQTNFTYNGESHKFLDFECRYEIEPLRKKTDQNCLRNNPNAKTVKVGYQIGRRFVEVYDVCLDNNMLKSTPIYAKHHMERSLAYFASEITQRYDSETLTSDRNLYNCQQEAYTNISSLAKWFNRKDSCCFTKRQLVNSKDVFQGLPQKATQSYLNIVPHWSSCNSENWETVENDVRNLAKSAVAGITVWTGIANPLFVDKPVSRFLWKVVQEPVTKASVAIIQLNVPDITKAEAQKDVRCTDICKEISWLNSDHFHDVRKGYTYCCNIIEFEKTFDFEHVFDRKTGKLLYDNSGLSEHYL